jgi:hypothetical protein
MKDLAVLIPCYNGGARLLESVESCAAAGLSADRYALIVVDNCSTDGSIETLPRFDRNNVPIQIYRNENNLGRVANWNRAFEIAEQEGYDFATFLFVGDMWVPAASIEDLLDLMQRSEAVLGMAPVRIVEEINGHRRDGARISIPGRSALVNSERLLEHAVRVGRLPFAPIQANVYRLFADLPLRFDDHPEQALNTDIETTVSWLKSHPGTIALIAEPYLVWSGYAGRFLSTQDPWFVLLETRASLQRVSQATGVTVDWTSANVVSLYASARELSEGASLPRRIAFLYAVARYLWAAPGGLAMRTLARFAINKFLHQQSYLSLPEGSTLLLHTGALQSRAEAVLTRCGL